MKLSEMSVYADSVNLAKAFRKLFKTMDRADQFSIGQQMLRSSVSISSNISEGVGRDSSFKALLVYLGYAKGSLYEFKTQMEIMEEEFSSDPLYKSIQEMIPSVESGLIKFSSFIERSK